MIIETVVQRFKTRNFNILGLCMWIHNGFNEDPDPESLHFLSSFFWVIFAHLHLDPDSADQNQCGSRRIRIQSPAEYCLNYLLKY
jgi:hypothetical protein